MDTPLPSPNDIDELLSFLPSFLETGEQAIAEWKGGTTDADGVLSLPWPVYSPLVERFFTAASEPCWNDRQYDPSRTKQMLDDSEFVATASLDQVKTMLTYCVRGERFCDGHWGGMIREGHILRLLQRLQKLSES